MKREAQKGEREGMCRKVEGKENGTTAQFAKGWGERQANLEIAVENTEERHNRGGGQRLRL